MSNDSRISILKDRLFQIKSQLQTKIQTIKHNLLSRSQAVILAGQSLADNIRRHSDDLLRLPDHHSASSTRLVPSLAVVRAGNRVVAPYVGLFLISLFVVVGNQANQHAYAAAITNYDDRLVTSMDPTVVEDVLRTLDELTPEIDEQPEVMASALVTDDDNYLSRPEMALMVQAEASSRKDPIPYVVQQGDTLVNIAKLNGRSVATILEANAIKPEDAGKITPGATLLIPQEDTSQSLAWLEADQRARAEVARIAAEKAAAARARSRTSVAKAADKTSRQTSSAGFSGTASGGYIVPINHNGISRGLGKGHTGIDYRASTGTAVVAGANGRVIEITHGWAGGWGNSILLDHGGQTSRYAHLSSVAVSLGETVDQGQVIGYSGNTGRSTGPHLHFEVRAGGRAIYPF